MNFQRGSGRDEPEINLIPMIDVLLVILLFLMVTTTFSHLSQLSINLPQATQNASDKPQGIDVAIDAAGHLAVNGQVLPGSSLAGISAALRQAAGNNNSPMIIISADARATHQSVIDVMEAARQAGFDHITFATQARQ